MWTVAAVESSVDYYNLSWRIVYRRLHEKEGMKVEQKKKQINVNDIQDLWATEK